MKLRAEHLVKQYKSRKVVNDVSIEVNQGEIVGLLGPNGAGKTTTFYMVVGLIKADQGRIFLDDTELTKNANVQKGAIRHWVFATGSIGIQKSDRGRKCDGNFGNDKPK